MPVNGQYTDSEIRSIDHRKIKGLSLVGKTNLYTDLDNIPTEFPPSEHISTVHTPVSETNDGYVPKEVKRDYLNNLLTFVNVGVKFDTNLHQLLLGYQSIDTSFSVIDDGSKKSLSFAEGVGSSIKIDSTTGEPIFDFDDGYTGTAVGPPGLDGDKGDDGKNSMVWYPTLDINGNLSWKLYSDSNPATIIQKTEWILGIEGKDGRNGVNGKIWIPRVRDSRYLTWVKMEYADYDLALAPTFIKQNGDMGEQGDPGITWLPSVDMYGNLSWSASTEIDEVNDYTFSFDFQVTDVSIFSGINGKNGVNQNVYTLGLTKINDSYKAGSTLFISENGVYNKDGNVLNGKSIFRNEYDDVIIVQTELEATYYKLEMHHGRVNYADILVCEAFTMYTYDSTKKKWKIRNGMSSNGMYQRYINFLYTSQSKVYFIGDNTSNHKIIPLNHIHESFVKYLCNIEEEGEI